jgi:LEA14-like dessication related protein
MFRSAAHLVVAVTLLAAVACSKPKPVQITPQSVQLASVGPDGVGVSLLLNVHNPNGFPIVAQAVSATFELEDGSELGRGNSTTAFTIPADGDTALPAELSMRWTNLAALTPYALAGKALPYRISGTARLGGESLNMDLPFSIAGQLTPEQVLAAGLRGAAALVPQR